MLLSFLSSLFLYLWLSGQVNFSFAIKYPHHIRMIALRMTTNTDREHDTSHHNDQTESKENPNFYIRLTITSTNIFNGKINCSISPDNTIKIIITRTTLISSSIVIIPNIKFHTGITGRKKCITVPQQFIIIQ